MCDLTAEMIVREKISDTPNASASLACAFAYYLAKTKRSPTSYPEGEVWDEFWGNDETISDPSGKQSLYAGEPVHRAACQYQPLG